ncbi:MAG: hypothetical protein ACRDK3_09475, partial [Actinomycetota bacterium]
TLRSTGNIIVRGKLVMRPATKKTVHKVIFAGVNERRFRGGTMNPVASDVGLWVMGKGVLNIAGAPKTAWTRTVGGVSAGATEIRLEVNPDGWRVGDVIAIAPTRKPSAKEAGAEDHTSFDVAVVRALDGDTITLEEPTRFDHPAVNVGGKVFTPEILNLTRNVRIQGTKKGRSHVFIRSSRPQTIKYAALSHMGPRKKGEKILGRWPLHFHHCHGRSRGSLIEGVVMRAAGSHAFVAHESNGVVFRDDIAYDCQESPFWWDDKTLSFDTVYDRCVAAKTDNFGFALFKGKGNIVADCVAVGVVPVDHTSNASGYRWPSAKNEGLWTSENCVSHNNARHGVFFWSNSEIEHHVQGFDCYHNGRSGTLHGAYKNGSRYTDCTFTGGEFPVRFKASSKLDRRQEWVRCTFDGAGGAYAGWIENRLVPGGQPVLVQDCTFVGKVLVDAKNTVPITYDFVRCGLEPNDFDVVMMARESLIRVQRADGTAFQIDHTGLPIPIPPFAPA